MEHRGGGRIEFVSPGNKDRAEEPLPTMPLRLTGDLFVPVELEATYMETCRQRRLVG